MKKLEQILKKYGKDAKIEMTIDDLYEFANYIIKEVSSNNEDKSKMLSIEEVSKILKKSPSTIYRWQKLGWINTYKVGRHTYYKEEEILQYTNGYRLVR
ncbi:MAG: helix-turn-helix domain-containing protein [Alistipes sp.]|nr:helix-turn-helix domain-containing protein [Alistipes sp.]